MADEHHRWPLGRARPLFGYRERGAEPGRSTRTIARAWIILAVLIVLYLAWTLTVYFLEPGLR
jgi:hypothetical protein